MKVGKRSRRFGRVNRTHGDEFPIFKTSPFTIGFNDQINNVSGDNFMKKFIKYIAPYAKKHGLRTVGNSLKIFAEGDKKIDSIKKAVGDEFDYIISGKSGKKTRPKKKGLKARSKNKSGISKKRPRNKGGFKKIN